MTQAMNLANFANSLDSSGQLPPTQLNAPVPISKGGTNASTAPAARVNLGSTTVGDAVFIATSAAAARTAIGTVIGTDVPSPTGTGASGTWDINITGNADTATTADSATTAVSVSGIVPVANGGTGTSNGIAANVQLFTSTGTWTKPTAGQSMAFIEVWGGGGSGGGGQAGGGAGGGGGYTFTTVPLSELPSSFTATVGAGGATAANGTNGNTGGTSSIPTAIYGRSIYATGGGGGAQTGAGGSGGAGLIPGNSGGSSASGVGGSCAQGVLGGVGAVGSGGNRGGGGGGGYANGVTGTPNYVDGGGTGGAGGNGAVRITCY